MTLKLRSQEALRRVQTLRRNQPLGPGRMVRYVELMEEDAAALPVIDAPADVVETRQAFEAACAWARGVAGEIEAAGAAAQEAHAADVTAAAAAMAEGKARPKTSAAKSAERLSGALVGVEAAERLIEEAHERLVDAVYRAWVPWRRKAVSGAAGAHANARDAMRAAAEAVAAAQERYALVSTLDQQMLARSPILREAAENEVVHGLNLYAETHDARRPLRVAEIPGQKVKGKPATAELSAMLDSCRRAVDAEAAFGPAEWSPWEDPERPPVAPLDLTRPWVRFAVGRRSGTVCPYCRQPGAETVVEDGPDLILVHAACEQRAENDPKAKARRKRGNRIASYQRHGWPSEGSGMDAALREDTERQEAHKAWERAAFPGQ